MKILVTGANGFLGFNLVKKLLFNGFDVYALTKSPIDFSHPKLNIVLCDLIDINLILKGVTIDVVFHTAAKINFDESYEGIAQITRDNIMTSVYLAEFVTNNKIKKLIVSSTCSVYEENYNIENWTDESHKLKPVNLYSVSKLTSEWILENKLKGIIDELTFLRYSSIYGYGQRPESIVPTLIRNASSNKVIELKGTGCRIQDYVYIADVVQANLNCLNRKLPFNSVFNIGSGEQINDLELAEKIREIWKSQSDIIIKNTPEKPEFFLNYSIQKAKKILNYIPVSLEKGLNVYFNLYTKG